MEAALHTYGTSPPNQCGSIVGFLEEGCGLIRFILIFWPSSQVFTCSRSKSQEVRNFFAGRPWNSVTPQDIFRFRHALPLFSPSALAYFAAAWMTGALQDEDAVDTGIEDLISNLERSDPGSWTSIQRAAICAWLAYFKTRWRAFLAHSSGLQAKK